jgi:hypothetical protein
VSCGSLAAAPCLTSWRAQRSDPATGRRPGIAIERRHLTSSRAQRSDPPRFVHPSKGIASPRQRRSGLAMTYLPPWPDVFVLWSRARLSRGESAPAHGTSRFTSSRAQRSEPATGRRPGIAPERRHLTSSRAQRRDPPRSVHPSKGIASPRQRRSGLAMTCVPPWPDLFVLRSCARLSPGESAPFHGTSRFTSSRAQRSDPR